MGWLFWHLTRVQDDHVAELPRRAAQIWAPRDRGPERCGLEPDPSNTGYGHAPDQVDAVRPDSPGALLGYLRRGRPPERSRFLEEHVTAAELDRVVDRRWDRPVTLGVRLVSVADDCLQRVGQAAYVGGCSSNRGQA